MDSLLGGVWKVLFSTLKFGPRQTRKKKVSSGETSEKMAFSPTVPLLGWASFVQEVRDHEKRGASHSTDTE